MTAPTPADGSRLSWVAFGLALVAPLVVGLDLLGVNAGQLTIIALPAAVGSVVVAILALRRRALPRWPAITAIVLAGVWLVTFAAFALWALFGLVQIMFAPTY